MSSDYQSLAMLAQARDQIINANHDEPVNVAVVLGSGLGEGAKELFTCCQSTILPYATIAGWPNYKSIKPVKGHKNLLLLGNFVGKHDNYRLAIMQGRPHYYQGYTVHETVFLLRALILAGAKTVILCSAVGAAKRGRQAGEIVVISDHLNLTGVNPLIGIETSELLMSCGPQFTDQSEVYDKQLAKHLHSSGATTNSATYAFMTGPSYETPAEIHSLAQLGASVVGMSMPLEAMAANQLGAKIGGLTLITNMGAGLGGKLSHQEVIAMTDLKRPDFYYILWQALLDLPKPFYHPEVADS